MNKFDFTDDEFYILADAVSSKLIDAYESCELHEGNPDWSVYEDFKKHLEEVKVLFEKIKGTSADRYLEIYEEVLASEHEGGF